MQRFIEAVNNRDFNTLDELVAPNLVRHSQATPGINVRSLDDFKQFLRQDLETFPDAHQAVNMMIAEGDKVALYMTLTGTQEGAMGPYSGTQSR